MEDIYKNQTYLEANPTWHEEDSPWKASQVAIMIKKHGLLLQSIAEIGCGGGGILTNLQSQLTPDIDYQGFDIAPAAIAMAKKKERDRLHFFEADLLQKTDTFDLLLIMDVIEHIPDYFGFLEKCRKKAKYKIYHIPLDLHVSSMARATFVSRTLSVGHIHYFSAESALFALNYTGHTIIDFFYTDGAHALQKLHPRIKTKLANVPRSFLSLFSTRLAARLLGGYSLLVLTSEDKN